MEPPSTGGSGLGVLFVLGMCVLLAALIFAARRNDPRPPRPPRAARGPNAELWNAVTREPGTWTRTDADGRTHEIVVDEQGNAEHRVDNDGDGEFDTRTRIERPQRP